MAKDLKGGLQSVFSSSKNTEAPETKNETTNTPKSTQQGLSEEYDRETFIVRVDLMDKIKDIAYWDRQLLKETVEAAFTKYVESWEKDNGKLKSRPDEVKEREKLRSRSGRKPGSANK